MAIDTAKVIAVADTALSHDDCACIDSATTTRVTVGPTTFEVDHVDGDGKPRTQADVESIISTLCKSTDAQAATDKLVAIGELTKTGTTYTKTGVQAAQVDDAAVSK
jgi:hypothetical protein